MVMWNAATKSDVRLGRRHAPMVPARQRPVRLVAAAALSLTVSASALAQVVLQGSDMFTTTSGTTYDMSGNTVPADFFGPGSDPFDGAINLVGDPFDPGGPLGTTDTIVRRLEDAQTPFCGTEDTIAIEIVALSLKSADPITVTFNGGMDVEQWDVRVCLSDVPQGQGTMTIQACLPDGGSFASSFPLQAKFVFTRTGSPSDERVLDTGVEGMQPDLVTNGFVPWVYEDSEARTVPAGLRVDGNCDGALDSPLPGTTNFVGGIGRKFCSCETPPGGRQRAPIVDLLNWGEHRFVPTPNGGNGNGNGNGIPAVTEWGVVIMAMLLLVGAKVYFSRRRATA